MHRLYKTACNLLSILYNHQMQLSEYLKNSGETVSDFASKAGLSEQAIYKLSNGERMYPRRSTVDKIIEATKGRVTANDFYNISPTKPKKGART